MSLYEEQPRSKCVLYSFGVNHETRFEGDMLDRTDCEILPMMPLSPGWVQLPLYQALVFLTSLDFSSLH